MWTIMHAPALNIPGFKGANGMPIGVTLVGGRYKDMNLLHVGKSIGRAFEAKGGWVLELK
jgi:amidase